MKWRIGSIGAWGLCLSVLSAGGHGCSSPERGPDSPAARLPHEPAAQPPGATRCLEACWREGLAEAECQGYCQRRATHYPADLGRARAQEPVTPPAVPKEGTVPEIAHSTGTGLTAGTYRCPTCSRAQRWQVSRGLLYWEGVPYVPTAGFRTSLAASPGITEANIWMDEDHRTRGMTEREYLQELDALTRDITERGGTYILLVGYPGPSDRQAARLADGSETTRIASKWTELAPRVSKPGLRALLLYNEINVEWNWGEGLEPRDQAEALGRLARLAQTIFGEVPVLYKSLGTVGGFRHVLLAAAQASGLGLDIFPRGCSGSGFDPHWEGQLRTLTEAVRSVNPGLVWATEWGKGAWEEAPRGQYWKAWPPFSTKSELQCVLERLVRAGFTGFIYNGPHRQEYDQSYRWYGEMRLQIVQETLNRAAASPGRSAPAHPSTP